MNIDTEIMVEDALKRTECATRRLLSESYPGGVVCGVIAGGLTTYDTYDSLLAAIDDGVERTKLDAKTVIEWVDVDTYHDEKQHAWGIEEYTCDEVSVKFSNREFIFITRWR